MRHLMLGLVLGWSSLCLAASSSQSTGEAQGSYTVECVLANPAYTGPCTVSEETPKALSPRAACKRILWCLNNPRCVTKTYCNATAVRGGWTLRAARGQAAKRSR